MQDPINFDDYVFRIVPMLNYRQRNELEVLKESRNRSGRSLGRYLHLRAGRRRAGRRRRRKGRESRGAPSCSR